MGCIKERKAEAVQYGAATEIVREKYHIDWAFFRVQTIRLNEQTVDAKDVQR